MKPKDIQIGKRLELERINSNGERVGNTYISQMLEYQDDGLIVISAPIFEARLIYVPDAEKIRLTYIDKKHGLLGFTALVKMRGFRGNVAILVIEPDSDISKIQRRMNYRLDIVLNTLISLPGDDREPVRAFTKNISGSGICLVSPMDIPINTKINVELELSDGMIIVAGCVVLRNNAALIRKEKMYELGMRFIDISGKNQEILIKFIFDQQRLQIKKENK